MKTVVNIIRVNVLCAAVLPVFIASGQLGLLLIAYLVAFFHELGHIAAAVILKYKVTGIEILPVGICALVDKKLKNKPQHELLVAACGPVVNLLCIIICMSIYKFCMINTQVFTVVNLYMLIINLLPIMPLDGGRILNACLALEFKKKRAEAISRAVSVFMTVAVLVLGCMLFVSTRANFSLLAAALYLMGSLKLPDKNIKMAEIAEAPISDVSRVKTYVMPGGMTVLDAAKEIDKNEICIIYISDDDGNVVSETTNKRLFGAMASGMYYEKIGDL